MDAGTRPDGKLGAGPVNVAWFAGKIGVSKRQMEFYRNGSRLPRNLTEILAALFGENPIHTARRAALIDAFNKAHGIELSGATRALSNIPIRIPTHFMGRDEPLAQIQVALQRYEGRVAITALHGLRGVGKTVLAAFYAERHSGAYRATWWIRAQTEPNLRADLVGLGVRLGWVAADDKEDPALAAVMERLRDAGEDILLIYDNAIEARSLTQFLPRGGAARIIITSNAHAWRGVAEPVEIRVWPKSIGADYLIARTGRAAERAAAEELSEALGGLPLALEQAAAYCERLDIPLAEYRHRFDVEPDRLLDDDRDAPTDYYDRRTVAKTFALAIGEASKLHPAAEPLLFHWALLTPEPIPLFLFSEAREKFSETFAFDLTGDSLDEAVAALRVFALVDLEIIPDERDPSISTRCVRLHRLVRQVADFRCTGTAREGAHRVLLEAMAAVCPERVFNDPVAWPRARRLDALAMGALSGKQVPPSGAELPAATLMMMLGQYRHWILGDYPEAQSFYERALAIREVVLGPNHLDTAVSLINLGSLLREQTYLAEARPLLERALAIREKTLGPNHPETATSLDDLARVLRGQGDLVAAQPLFERALAIREKMLGSSHPETATSLQELAVLHQARGDLTAARPLLERALVVHEATFGPEHFEVGTSVNNLAGVVRDQGDLALARLLYERAQAIYEKALGPDHPWTGRARYNHAHLLLAVGEPARALAAGEAALAAHEKTLGPNHPWTRDSARATAKALAAARRSEEAAALRARYGIDDDS